MGKFVNNVQIILIIILKTNNAKEKLLTVKFGMPTMDLSVILAKSITFKVKINHNAN